MSFFFTFEKWLIHFELSRGGSSARRLSLGSGSLRSTVRLRTGRRPQRTSGSGSGSGAAWTRSARRRLRHSSAPSCSRRRCSLRRSDRSSLDDGGTSPNECDGEGDHRSVGDGTLRARLLTCTDHRACSACPFCSSRAKHPVLQQSPIQRSTQADKGQSYDQNWWSVQVRRRARSVPSPTLRW